MTSNALEKRIKRRITARSHRFFISCQPGLARICLDEVQRLLPAAVSPEAVQGGIEFTGRADDCYRLNLLLGSASRITLRIGNVKAENFRTLERKLHDIDWELFLLDAADFSIDVTTHRCRLYHSEAIAQRVRACIIQHLSSREAMDGPPGKRQHQTLFVRGVNNRFELSLDSSGDLLHKRGIRTAVGGAPIRETLAWGILRSAGYTGNEPLLDPMCGSGTFSLEAAMVKTGTPPGFFRKFAFESWPCFSKAAFLHMKNQAEAKILQCPSGTIFASDLDKALLDAFSESLTHVGLDACVSIRAQDFFTLTPTGIADRPGIIVLNPPYGIRLGTRENIQVLYAEIGKKLSMDFKGWRVGIVVPETSLASSLFLSRRKMIPCFHGGLDISVVTGIIN